MRVIRCKARVQVRILRILSRVMASRARVLVVDDDQMVGSELEQELDRPEVAVHVATTAQAANDLLDENRYSVIILDIVLAGGSGFDVLHHARRKGVDAPFIVVSAYVPEYVRELLAELELVRIIHPKPYDTKALAALVLAWIDGLP